MQRRDLAQQQADIEERTRALETRAHPWWRDSWGGWNSNWASLTVYAQAGWDASSAFNYVSPQWRVRSDKVVFHGTVQRTAGGSPALVLPGDIWPPEDTTQLIVTDTGKAVVADVTAANGHVDFASAAWATDDLVALDAMWWPYALLK